MVVVLFSSVKVLLGSHVDGAGSWSSWLSHTRYFLLVPPPSRGSWCAACWVCERGSLVGVGTMLWK